MDDGPSRAGCTGQQIVSVKGVALPAGAVAMLERMGPRLVETLDPGGGTATLSVEVLNVIVPGRPLLLRWRLDPALGGHLPAVGPVIDIELFLMDRLDTLGSLGTFRVDSRAGTREVALRGAPELLRRMYAVGTSLVQARLSGNGTAPGPYVGEVEVSVVGERVGAGWWDWTIEGGFQQPWKSSYQIAGRVLNRSQVTAMTVTISLVDAALDGSAPSVTTDHVPVLVPRAPLTPGASVASAVAVAFPPIVKDWTWILDGVCLYTGPTDRWYRYTVSLRFTDDFGNRYDTTDAVNVQVIVSDLKQLSGLHATQLMVSAAVFLGLAIAAAAGFYTAVGAPFLFGVASALQTSAQIVCGVAKDPPVPDFDFLNRVVAVLPDVPAEDGTPSNVWRRLAVLTTRIHATYLALSATQGKLEGARLVSDLDGVTIQATAYLAMVAGLKADVATLAEVYAAGAAATRRLKITNAVVKQAAIAARQGVSPEVVAGWVNAAGSREGLDETISRLTDKEGPADGAAWNLAALLPDFAACTAALARSTVGDTPFVVAGPTQLRTSIEPSIALGE